jgi:hypothetical protein
LERVAAALGTLDGAPVEFAAVDDVPQGGVLCALPALLLHGLLRHTRSTFNLPKGFYPLESIFLDIRETSRLCREDSQSLTAPGVA